MRSKDATSYFLWFFVLLYRVCLSKMTLRLLILHIFLSPLNTYCITFKKKKVSRLGSLTSFLNDSVGSVALSLLDLWIEQKH